MGDFDEDLEEEEEEEEDMDTSGEGVMAYAFGDPKHRLSDKGRAM